MFKYDRFNKNNLLLALRNANVKNSVIMMSPDYDFEIGIADTHELEQSDLKNHSDIIIEVLKHIPDFDNIVQKSCEDDYKNSNLHIRNFLFSLAYIDISDIKIALTYWGDEVNSDFEKIFIKKDEKWILLK